MSDLLKGNYKAKGQAAAKPFEKKNDKAPSIEDLFESSTLEKLGGSMAFVKKSGSFIWKGDKK